MMTFDKFTIEAQETVQEAMNLAQNARQQTTRPIHSLSTLLNKRKDVMTLTFQKLSVSPFQTETLARGEIKHLLKVLGG